MPHEIIIVGVAEVQVCRAEPYRKVLIFQNQHAAQTIDLYTQAGRGTGYRLYAGDSIAFHQSDGDTEVKNYWYAIASGATTHLLVMEELDELLAEALARRMDPKKVSTKEFAASSSGLAGPGFGSGVGGKGGAAGEGSVPGTY